MKKILLIGYTRQNLGDDIFLNIVINRYKKYQFDLFCPNRFSTPFRKAKNINIINEDFFKNDNINIDNYSMCIYVGGSIFKESLKDYENKEWLNKFVLSCKSKSIPFYFISSNFGPYKTEKYYNLCKNILKNVEQINFRETYSHNLFKLKNAKYIPDLVFSMDYSKKETINNSVGISVINLYSILRPEINKYNFGYISFLKNNIKEYINNGKKVYLFSFCKHEKDELAIKTLLSFIEEEYHKNIKVINYNGNIKKFLDIYSRMEYMLCTRFHSMILSAYFNQKIVVCSYSNKVSNVIKDYNFDCEFIKIDEKIGKEIIKINRYKKCNNVENIKELSFNNYICLDNKIHELFNDTNTYDNKFYNNYFNYNNLFLKAYRKITRKNVKKKKSSDIVTSNKELLTYSLNSQIINKETYNNCMYYLGYLDKQNNKKSMINDGPLVSVIIPTYKRNDYLIECIDSILKQDYKNIEIIIVDDYVESNLKSVIDKKYKNNKNVIYTKNKVKSKAGISRQNGYNISKGKYIIYCDDDDFYIDYSFISNSVSILESDKLINFVGYNSFHYYEDKKMLKFNNVNYNEVCNCLDYLVSFQLEFFKPCPSFTIFRRSILDENNFKDMKMMNDSSIFLNAMQKNKMLILNNPIGFYRQHSANITLNLKPEFIIENMEEKKKVYLNLKKVNAIANIDYWWYQQNKLTLEYFIKGSRPSVRNYLKMINWSLNNMKEYKYKLFYEMTKLKLITAFRRK